MTFELLFVECYLTVVGYSLDAMVYGFVFCRCHLGHRSSSFCRCESRISTTRNLFYGIHEFFTSQNEKECTIFQKNYYDHVKSEEDIYLNIWDVIH